MGIMAIVLSHMSSIQFLESEYFKLQSGREKKLSESKGPYSVFDQPPLEIPSQMLGPLPEDTCTYDLGLLKELIREVPLSTPVQRLTNCSRAGNESRLLCNHALRDRGLNQAYVRVSDNLYACTPEYSFALMGRGRSLIEHIALGFELCGCYTTQGARSLRMAQRPQLTTVKKICRQLEQFSGVHGVQQSRKACIHIVDGSASPAETTLVMLLALPHRLGGYGLPAPKLNNKVTRYGSKGTMVSIGDLVWPRLVVEYDSYQEHASYSQAERDARRRNDLSPTAKALQVTTNQVGDPEAMDHLAMLIAKNLGVRFRCRCKEYEERKANLRRELNRVNQNRWLK